MRVLIVEDEYLIATSTAATLRAGGCTIVGIVATVADALRQIEEQECDAAVLDANLNGLSAEPVAQALQQRGIPFVVASGYSMRQLQGVMAGAPFVAKPFRSAELIALVLALCRHA